MISRDALLKQLERLKFNPNGWGRSEVNELVHILLPDEEIEQLVNGYYEAGFALLVATKHRLLLVDKKPLNYLTVEDMRFDMISEFDYSHRLVGAHLTISSGSKQLKFTSLNQQRLRELLAYVQKRMTDIKVTMHEQQETQQQHLETMNDRLSQYLAATSQQVVASEVAKQLANAGPQYTKQAGYELPQPMYTPTEPLYDMQAFERAAAQSAAQQMTVPTPVASVMQRTVSPQEVGLAAVRRVVPIAKMYSRKRQSPPASATGAA